MSFQQEILRTCEVPMKYEDSQLLDKVLEILPLEFIYTRAEEAEKQDSAWGLQDYVIRELLKWFKHSFFTWVNSPSCESCSGETQRQGIGQPTDQERIQGGAGHVEIYNCTQCGKIERFPRYGNAAILLQTRRGRCGEWANVSDL